MKITKLLSLVSGIALTAGLALDVSAGGGGPPAPTTSASKVRFTFTADTDPAKIMPIRRLDGVEIWPATNETNITHYNVYWGDSERNKLGLALAPRLAHIPATYDGKVLRAEFNSIKMEAGAIWVLVCTENDGTEYCGKANNMEKITDPLIDINNTLSAIKNNISSHQSCAGVDVMATCGDLVCNGVETESNCPSDCSTWQQASFNYQTLCDEVQNIYTPTTVAQIQQIINDAVANNQHVKITGGANGISAGSTGSASEVICTDGVIIDMGEFDLNAPGLAPVLETFEGQEVVNVSAGTSMHELGEWLHARGRGVGFTHLGWRDVSIGGAIGTSAHGSSPKNNGVLSQRVVGLEVVTADGQLNSYSAGTTGVSDPDLWKALTTNLGYMGVVTRARIAVEASKNVHVKLTFHKEDELFENNPDGSVYNNIKDCDYGQYNWFPSQNRFIRHCGKVTTAAWEPGADNKLLFPYVDLSQLSEQQTMQIMQVGACDLNSGAHEQMAYMRINGWHLTPPHVKTIGGSLRYTTDIVAPIHRATSAHLIDTMSREMFQMDWELAVPHQNMQAAMEYIRNWSNGQNASNRNMALNLIGFFIRFSKSEDNTLMAYTGTGGPFQDGTTVVHIEMPIYVPVGLSQAQFDAYMAPFEEATSTLINQFGARGHWGKNQHSMDRWVFAQQVQAGSYDYDNRLQRFSAKVGQVDPNGLFANKFAKTIGITYPNFTYPANW